MLKLYFVYFTAWLQAALSHLSLPAWSTWDGFPVLSFCWLVVMCATHLGINSYGLEAGLPESWKKKNVFSNDGDVTVMPGPLFLTSSCQALAFFSQDLEIVI